MKKSDKNRYKKLPGRAAGLYRRERLWLGPDHLLAVESNTYQECYQRYYFKDIQAFLIRKTAKGRIFNGLCAVPTLLAAVKLSTPTVWNDPAWVWFWGLITAFLLVLLLVNIFKGPTCACHLHTPISTERLPSLHRLRTARKVRDRLKLLIEKEQGRLDRKQMLQTIPALRPDLVSAGEHIAGNPKTLDSAAAMIAPYRGWAHRLLLLCSLAMAAFLVLYLYAHGLAMAGAGLLLTAILLVVNLIALAKQAGSTLPAGLKSFTWSTLVLLAVTMGLSYFGLFFTLIGNRQFKPMFSQWGIFTAMAQIDPMESPFLSAIFIIAAISLTVAALIGAVSLLGWRRIAPPDAAGPDDAIGESR
jgi:hypothetical protein